MYMWLGALCPPRLGASTLKKIVTAVLLALAVVNAAQQPTVVIEAPVPAEFGLVVNI